MAYAIAADHNEVVDALERFKRADPNFVKDARRSASLVKTDLLNAVKALQGEDNAAKVILQMLLAYFLCLYYL